MADFGQIEVEVKFVIGDAQLPLSKIRRLERGAVIPLGRDASSPIAVEANGHKVRAASVKILGERVAVQMVG